MNRLGNREIFRVAGPILLSLLFQQMIGLTDTEKSSSEPPRSAASGFSPSTCSASASASACRS